ncbi:UDP-glucose 4-epimerase GalE [Planctobacterium marinum]|uniref:UDP-glucose 4-epimerase n=1 Tax=Planctobacterium marinum TaxID=1631968 RepID=A0AA48KRB4_9ALTE|nr:UDP-glucose 4-epimerase GalE [Planctobacterium marinum]
MAKFLVLGGAGYIGSHMVNYLQKNHHQVVVFDNLSTGFEGLVLTEQFRNIDILDSEALKTAFNDLGPFDCVIHFCAKSLVGESKTDPKIYYRNNVTGTLNLLDVMLQTGHDKIIFSSTAATFGVPESEEIDESHPTHPINPYGQSKLMVEKILSDYAEAYGMRSVCLRYFNAAGADPSGKIGELHDPETHLIPNILKSVLGQTEATLKVFGTDYPTPDGSCIRDYIHVNDLSSAHFKAFEYIEKHTGAYRYNLGIGNGFSVLDVIRTAEKVVGKPIPFDLAERRAGDPPKLIADSTRAQKELGWQPQFLELEEIIQTAWDFHKNR